MPEKDKIYELTKLVEHHDDLSENFYRTMQNLQESFQKKYVRKLYSALDSKQQFVKEHPSREVVLLRALKGYANEPGRGNIDRAIDMLMFFQTANTIKSSLYNIQNENTGRINMASNESGQDGEDSVSNAAISMTGLLMALAMTKKL